MSNRRFIIEDPLHAEFISEHLSLADAWAELKRLSDIPWDQLPNLAPCGSWQTCGRNYHIIEFEVSAQDWRMLHRISALEVSAAGIIWNEEQPSSDA
jgi:hypothetical protein